MADFVIPTWGVWPIKIPLSGSGGDVATSSFNVVQKTANYMAQYNDLVEGNPTGGAFTVTLPTAASASPGKNAVAVKNESNSPLNITIAQHAGDTIDLGSGSYTLMQGQSLYLVSDGVSNWIIVTLNTATTVPAVNGVAGSSQTPAQAYPLAPSWVTPSGQDGQQSSPPLLLGEGQRWNGASSDPVFMRARVEPVQAGANMFFGNVEAPWSQWVIEEKLNSGAWIPFLSIFRSVIDPQIANTQDVFIVGPSEGLALFAGAVGITMRSSPDNLFAFDFGYGFAAMALDASGLNPKHQTALSFLPVGLGTFGLDQIWGYFDGKAFQNRFSVNITSTLPRFAVDLIGGQFSIQQLPAPTITSLAVVGGAAQTVTYALTNIDQFGNETLAATSTVNNGPAVFDASHYIIVNWPAQDNVIGSKLYRTVGGPSQGLIQTIIFGNNTTGTANAFQDTGIAASVASPPTRNSTADAFFGGDIQLTEVDVNIFTVAGGGVGRIFINAAGVHLNLDPFTNEVVIAYGGTTYYIFLPTQFEPTQPGMALGVVGAAWDSLALGRTAALPIADAAHEGMIITVFGGVGVADVTSQCLKSIAGTYSWVTIATG